jgi:hypothetical protein
MNGSTKRLSTGKGFVTWGAVAVVCALHGLAIWVGLEGWYGLTNGWPLWRHDHPLHYHSARVTRAFLEQNGTTAGYDPSFMAGYAKSIVFPVSSTLPELVVAAFGGSQPEVAYKVYVLITAALIPWLVAGAGWLGRDRSGAVLGAVGLFLVYIWTDFPINYAAFGMLSYLLAIPLGLAATAVFVLYLERGGWAWWLLATAAMVVVILVHLTAVMFVAPASGCAYLAAVFGRGENGLKFSRSRHLGVWAIPLLVLAGNAFWWLPGIWLASTKGASDFAFVHPEGVLFRLAKIATDEPVIQRVLLLTGLPGLAVMVWRDRVRGFGVLGFALAGFFWGYLAGGFRTLDFLQPGRHTFAFYTALSLAAGHGLGEALGRLREAKPVRLDRVAALGLIALGVYVLGPMLTVSIRARLEGPIPFLSSRPSPRLLWVVNRVKTYVNSGERLLYEEGGFDLPGVPDPFQGGRFSGLLPERTGVELLGGPYLHATLTTNFTQFGEGRLFGAADWGRDRFVRYARLYRPAAIVCWNPRARAFCRDNPDLVRILDDDGMVLIGRVLGFEGEAITGTAQVEAGPGRLVVRNAVAGVDGTVVLRYHSVPCLRARPPIRWEPVFREADPVPFIRLYPPAGRVTFELRVPPWSEPGRGRSR